MIKFACPSCSKSMHVDDRHAGKKGKCPKCGNTVVVPERSTLIEFDCEGCGHTLKVSDKYAGKTGRCPTCKNPVQVPAVQDAFTEAPAPEPPDTVESDAPEETPYEASEGQDRRRVVILAGGATGLAAVIIGLVILFWPSHSPPALPPIRSQETTNTEQPEPVTPDVTQDLTSTPETNEETHLQFNPSPGTRQAMQVTTQLVMSNLHDGQLMEVKSTQSVAVDLDVRDRQADGVAALNVSISRIHVKTETQGMVNEYDSAEPSSQDSPMAGYYLPYVGKAFAIHVSGQGEIVNTGLDELYLTVAKDRVEAEDDMLRSHNAENAEAAIERTDQRFGSRDGRILAMKKQLEEFPLFGREQVLRLLGDLICPLPSQPITNNMTWDGTITVKAEMNEDVPATYSVTSLDRETCVIEAHGKRSEEDPPFVYQAGQTTVTTDLAGSSQVTLIVDRHTGWLKRKTQKTLLNGSMQQSLAGQAYTETATQVIMDITTSVEPVK